MPSTTNKIYSIPTHGTEVDTWDAPLNSNFAILDKNFGGVLTKSLSNLNVVLTASEAQNYVIRFTGALSANVVITFPAVGSFYCIENLTTGSFVVQLTTGGGENIATPQGSRTQVFTDGPNVRFVSDTGAWPGCQRWVYGTALPNWMGSCSVSPWLIMDGTTFSALTYPALNTVLGGNTLPDFRGRSPHALDNQGGVTAGRVTNAGSGIVGTTLGAAGGAESVVLTTNQIPSHTHANTLTDPTHTHAVNTGAASGTVSGNPDHDFQPKATATTTGASATGVTINNVAAGGGLLHTNMPPALIAGIFIIKT